MDDFRCRVCLKVKPVNQFSWINRKSEKRHTICKECHREKAKAHYYANKGLYRERNAKYKVEGKAYVDDLKSTTPCIDCGNIFPPECMDFDHLPSFKKHRCVSEMISACMSLKAIKREIEKCELVCANCHRIRTVKRTNGAM